MRTLPQDYLGVKKLSKQFDQTVEELVVAASARLKSYLLDKVQSQRQLLASHINDGTVSSIPDAQLLLNRMDRFLDTWRNPVKVSKLFDGYQESISDYSLQLKEAWEDKSSFQEVEQVLHNLSDLQKNLLDDISWGFIKNLQPAMDLIANIDIMLSHFKQLLQSSRKTAA